MAGMIVDFSDVPCFICKPKTLGECGHPTSFMDDEWMAEQSKTVWENAGREWARREDEHILAILTGDKLTP